MGEDDRKLKYPPNSSDIIAMCDYIRTVQDVLGPLLMRDVYQTAGTMFLAWVESLEMGGRPE
jgi:hypothetical protein